MKKGNNNLMMNMEESENIFEEFKRAATAIQSVKVNQTELTLLYKDDRTEVYPFDELKKVSIITTDEGPLQEDVFWLLMFERMIIMIAQGTQGSDALLARLQKITGFNNEMVVKAMQSTDNNSFEVWDTTAEK